MAYAGASSMIGLSYPQTHHFGKSQRVRFVHPSAYRRAYNVTLVRPRGSTCFALQGDGSSQTMARSGDGDIPSYPTEIINGHKNVLVGGMLQADDVSVGINVAHMDYETDEFSDYDDECDLDCPTEGFSSIPEAIEDIRQGKFVIVVDDEDRENEGDLIMAASKVTPDAMAFIVRHGTGIVCVSMKGEDLERLQLPLMVSTKENEEKLRTAFTVSVDAKKGTTTGVSARDRANTILALASSSSRPEDFNRPGHIFPLKYREGGVLKRAGHTEASVDLTVLAGLAPAAVLCELVDNDDGSMARLPKLREFAKRDNLKIISIADLVRSNDKSQQVVIRLAKLGSATVYEA